ncbi:MAG TPA: HisA/HisF-related TIM barrel protein [Gemmataceae bacterium]|nr:HisA/HisF-related TIM barrel protein [Gemmataceae bacterium]
MRIIPVLDLKDGLVVRGIAGRRHEYQPVVSRLTTSCRPVDVARAFRDHFGLTELYLADLDAIAGARPALPIYAAVHSLGFRLWVDAGVRDAVQAAELAVAGVANIILGLETVGGPGMLRQVCSDLGRERVIFSLDLKDGAPLGGPAWQGRDAWSIAGEAVAAGVRRLLVLDLARVGGGGGTGTEELCTRLAAAYPDIELAAGGGVNGIADLERLAQCGVRAVLVASALHDGRLRPEDLKRLPGHGRHS